MNCVANDAEVTRLEKEFVLCRQHYQPQIHVAGDADVTELEGVASGDKGALGEYRIDCDFDPG